MCTLPAIPPLVLIHVYATCHTARGGARGPLPAIPPLAPLGMISDPHRPTRVRYIDNEPHDPISLALVRAWDKVDMIASSGELSSRASLQDAGIDWAKFDALKTFILHQLASNKEQLGTNVEKNVLVYNFVDMVYHLLRCGFYTAIDLEPLVEALVSMLNGKDDKVGLHGESESPNERYQLMDSEKCSTKVIMQTKLCICKALAVVCTLRVDMRVSRLLAEYKRQYMEGTWAPTSMGGAMMAAKATAQFKLKRLSRGAAVEAAVELAPAASSTAASSSYVNVDIPGDHKASARTRWQSAFRAVIKGDVNEAVNQARGASDVTVAKVREVVSMMQELTATVTAAPTTAPPSQQSRRYMVLEDEEVVEKRKSFMREKRSSVNEGRKALSTTLCETVLPLDRNALEGGGDMEDTLFATLMDLTFYESGDLVSASLAMLVHETNQTALLAHIAEQVQIIEKPEVVRLHDCFMINLNALNRLAVRRRLIPDERYTATLLMSLLAESCYEEGNMMEFAENLVHLEGASQTSASRLSMLRASGMLSSHSGGDKDPEHLVMIGKGLVEVGSNRIEFKAIADDLDGDRRRLPFPNDRLVIEGCVVKVLHCNEKEILLDKPIDLEAGQVVPPTLNNPARKGVVWMMHCQRNAVINLDVQLLLMNLGAHRMALQLLQLPFNRQVAAPPELSVRRVILAAYRLLTAMTLQCSRMQSALLPHVPTFVAHGAVTPPLADADASPHALINAIFAGNRLVCTSIDEETIRSFVGAATGPDFSPTALRSLSSIICPEGRWPIKRNQLLVLRCLDEKEARLPYFKVLNPHPILPTFTALALRSPLLLPAPLNARNQPT